MIEIAQVVKDACHFKGEVKGVVEVEVALPYLVQGLIDATPFGVGDLLDLLFEPG
ncbi:MAG: hypothetical protein IPP37_11015 [Saprospiraceae bacterium]|nr:hypothetical protein [Saprospiraceae bacterium]